jgi:hypothetical protein
MARWDNHIGYRLKAMGYGIVPRHNRSSCSFVCQGMRGAESLFIDKFVVNIKLDYDGTLFLSSSSTSSACSTGYGLRVANNNLKAYRRSWSRFLFYVR